MEWTFDTLDRLISRFETSGLSELEFSDGTASLLLKKGTNAGSPISTPVLPSSPASLPKAEESPVPAERQAEASATTVKAPMAGTFYRAPSPDSPPFVEKGQAVKRGQTIGLMEAMKIMSEIPSPCDGMITDILAEDGSFAEFDAPLMIIGE